MDDRSLRANAKMAAALTLALALLTLLPSLSSAAADSPNIVLFLVDDMGWMDSTPYGSRYYETPNMQRLAGQAMRFTDAYAVPLCSPTRASILTGQYSSRHRVTSATGHLPAASEDAAWYPEKAAPRRRFLYARSKNYLDPELTTIAEVLKQAGYRTGHFGKWHLGLERPHWPEQHGFDVAFHAQPSPGPPSYFSPYDVHSEGKPSGRHHVGTITDGPDGEYITDRVTDEAIAFIDANRDRPFFLNLWHFAVHGPWGHKEEYTREFADKKDPRGEQRNPIMASMLKSVDESLGRVLSRLDQLGLTDRTLFIFYSDNGGNTHSNVPGSRQVENIKPGHPKWPMIRDWKKWAGAEPPTNNAPLREGKGRIYEGGQRVPLMVRWPGHIEPGTTSEAVVGPIDLYPTILDALNLEKPDELVIDGESLLPVLTQTGTLERQAYFTWFPHLIPAVSVRQGDWKLIRRFEPHPDYPEVLELYHLGDDVGETQNVARQHPEKVERLNALIDGFVRETGALYPRSNPNFQKPDKTAGLVPRGCKLIESGGALQVIPQNQQPFLGTARVKLEGPLTLSLRMRSAAGGKGRVTWKMKDQKTFSNADQSVSFEFRGDDEWQEIDVKLPISGTPQTIRLYLPSNSDRTEMQFIRFENKTGQVAWNF